MTTSAISEKQNVQQGPSISGGHFDPAAFDPNNYTWLKVVEMRSDEGAAWVEAFEKTPLPGLIERADEALFALRRGEKEKGSELLDEVRVDVEKLEAEHPEWPVVIVRRWLHGTEAFLHYLVGDFEAALEALDEAETAIRRSLESEYLLMPLAYQSLDFVVQRMRVARNERRWQELDKQADRARAMVDDRLPLFELEGDRQIFSQTVVDFYRACRLSTDERGVLEYFFSDGRPVRRFESKISNIVQPSGFVVPFH